jgi:hypothetical protein
MAFEKERAREVGGVLHFFPCCAGALALRAFLSAASLRRLLFFPPLLRSTASLFIDLGLGCRAAVFSVRCPTESRGRAWPLSSLACECFFFALFACRELIYSDPQAAVQLPCMHAGNLLSMDSSNCITLLQTFFSFCRQEGVHSLMRMQICMGGSPTHADLLGSPENTAPSGLYAMQLLLI